MGFWIASVALAEETQLPPDPEVTFEKAKYKCENYSFESPHPEKVTEPKAWLTKIELVHPEGKSLMIPKMTRNRGAIGPTGSWRFWDWMDSLHVYTEVDKEKKHPYYVIQILSIKEAYVLKYEESGEYQMTACQPTL